MRRRERKILRDKLEHNAILFVFRVRMIVADLRGFEKEEATSNTVRRENHLSRYIVELESNVKL